MKDVIQYLGTGETVYINENVQTVKSYVFYSKTTIKNGV